jgi:filamentous hemagglutinin family protein
MSQRESDYCLKLGLVILLVSATALIFENRTLAQIVPDETLGAESSDVNSNAVIDNIPSTQIDGGAIRETNLFHSFGQFNVSEGQRVYFVHPPEINNILTRVTGSSRSEILGQLGVLGNADLFLINPNGIIFGSNASLDIKGSFLVSTARSLRFADGSQFSATTSQTSPLLTVSVPVGLQYGADAAGILVQGASLLVQPGKTLGIVGGDVSLAGGYLNAPGGRIELGSVAADSFISLNPIDKGWSLGYENVQSFQNIQLKKSDFRSIASFVDTSGEGGGDIQVQGRQVSLADSSLITTQRAETGGNLIVNAAESLALTGLDSGLVSDTTTAADAGSITINTQRLLLSDGAFIATQSSIEESSSGQTRVATGRGGDLIVNASQSVELKNGSFISSSTQGVGDAGNITIDTERLIIGDGAEISAFTLSEGRGGTLAIKATDSVELNGEDSSLSAEALSGGNAGDISIATGNFTVRNGANVSASSSGTGSAGNLNLAADSISLEDGGKLVARSASGEGGNIRLNQLDLLLLRGGSEISTDAKGGTGNGGNITIDTDTLAIANNSNISANAVEGRGGNIRITTQALFVSPDSSINADSERGINGVVEIRRPDVDPTAELVILPANVVDVSGLVTQGCAADGSNLAAGQGQFTIAGRGGLPPTPAEATRSDTPLVDLGTPIQSQEQLTTTSIHSNSTSIKSTPPLIEANGWAIGDKGEVILTASSPNTPDIPWLTPTSCHSS